MKCSVCGADMASTITALPFKASDKCIVIVKDVPAFQCTRCPEYLLADFVVEEIERILEKVDKETELEVMRYAA